MALRNRNLPGLVPQVPKDGYGFLKAVLDCLSACSEELAERLDSPHRIGGNPGYPAQQMLRLHALRYLLNERFANRFLDRVDNEPLLLELCGMSRVPSEVAFSRFKNHRLASHQEELDQVIALVVEDCAAGIEELRGSDDVPTIAPALGEILAIDATDIPAYANPHREIPADPDATWGYRTPKNKSPKAEKGKKDLFFGYDADVISDAHYGLPLYLSVRPANLNEGPRLRADLDAALQLHPRLKPSFLTADKGYHAGYNFSHLVDQEIKPIIAIPRPPKDKETGTRLYEGLYSQEGLPVCIGGKEMDFLETGPDGDHRFRCPEEGCHLKGRTDWNRYCDFEYSEKPEGTRLRIMGIIHRASEEWKELFKKRTTIERYFSSAKHSRLLDRHQFLGQERVSLHARMSMLGYLLTSWGRLRADDYEHMRHMYIRLPRPSPVEEYGEARECAECCLCPQHGKLAT